MGQRLSRACCVPSGQATDNRPGEPGPVDAEVSFMKTCGSKFQGSWPVAFVHVLVRLCCWRDVLKAIFHCPQPSHDTGSNGLIPSSSVLKHWAWCMAQDLYDHPAPSTYPWKVPVKCHS